MRMNLLHTTAFAALLTGLTVIGATPALAQTPQPAQPDRDACQVPADQRQPGVTCPPADSQAGQLINQGAVSAAPGGNDIVVVGSRIRRNRFNTADPVTIITRDETVDSGFSSTAEALQSVGVTGGTSQINDTYGNLVVNGGPGVNTLGLRGLGATRTLVLLNGRRLSPAGTRGSVGAADLNVLPNAILDRIEVLNTGASSVYGSDAVAGVVNIVTLKKFNGIALNADVSVPEIGNGIEQRYAITAGASGDRWSILGSVEYYKRTRVTQGDLPWARCPQQLFLSGVGTAKGSGDYVDPATGKTKCFPFEDGGSTTNTIGTGYSPPIPGSALSPSFPAVPAGYNVYCNRWQPNSAITTGPLPGFQCVNGIVYNPTTGAVFASDTNVRNLFNPNLLKTDVISPSKSYIGYLSGTYDTGLFGDGQLYGELLVTRRQSQQNADRQFSIDYPRNSPLIPAPFAALAAARPFSATVGIRAFTDYGLYDSHQTEDYVKASGGFRGNFPFLNSWHYDFYASKAWSDGDYAFEQILADRLANSLDVVSNGAGGFKCRNAAGGCVAAPVLSTALIGNVRTTNPAWFDYVTDEVYGTTKFRETTLNATFDGPLFHLQGGDAQLAAGVEYRSDYIDDVPSSDAQRSNLYNFSSAPITKGSDHVWEGFGELELPVFRDLPFAKSLTINASTRYTDYHSYGSNWTYKVGGLYSPTSWLSFRGSYGTSYRAPALFEQFLGSTTGFQAGTNDPCYNLNAANTPTPIFNACRALGLPIGFQNTGSITVIGQGGAAFHLKPETSTNLTFGGVFQPHLGAFGNFSLAIDYYRIKVKNGVSQLPYTTILQACYDGTHPEYCQYIVRTPYTGPNTGLLTVTTSYINVANFLVRGIDFVARYDHRLAGGKIELGIEAVRSLNALSQTDPDSAPFEFNGTIGTPKWAGTGHVGYTHGPWYFRWGVDFIGHTEDNTAAATVGFSPAKYDFHVPDYWLHTASIRWERGNYSITAGVRNVFNKAPPTISAQDPLVNDIANVPLQGNWDFRGRTYFVNLEAKLAGGVHHAAPPPVVLPPPPPATQTCPDGSVVAATATCPVPPPPPPPPPPAPAAPERG